jgi:hypothetical protein
VKWQSHSEARHRVRFVRCCVGRVVRSASGSRGIPASARHVLQKCTRASRGQTRFQTANVDTRTGVIDSGCAPSYIRHPLVAIQCGNCMRSGQAEQYLRIIDLQANWLAPELLAVAVPLIPNFQIVANSESLCLAVGPDEQRLREVGFSIWNRPGRLLCAKVAAHTRSHRSRGYCDTCR